MSSKIYWKVNTTSSEPVGEKSGHKTNVNLLANSKNFYGRVPTEKEDTERVFTTVDAMEFSAVYLVKIWQIFCKAENTCSCSRLFTLPTTGL